MELSRASEIRAYLQEQRPGMIRMLGELVSMETPTRRPERQRSILDRLEAVLDQLGFWTHRIRGGGTGGHLFARPANRSREHPIQLLLGHCDTVWPVGTLNGMPLRIAPDRLRGPGSFDMKGGLTQMLFALRAADALELETSVTPVVLINSDEEIGSPESTRWIRHLARAADRALVFEPALGISGELKTARKGGGRFNIRVTGRSAHAGLEPEAGVSAILELSHVVQALHELNDPERGISVNVGTIEGGINPNIVASDSEAVVDVRVRRAEDVDEVVERIRGLTPENPGAKLEVTGGMGRPPMEFTEGNRRLWELAREAGQALEIDLDHATAGGASDGNTTSLFTAVGDGAHARHEYVDLNYLVDRTALVTLLLTARPLDQSARVTSLTDEAEISP